MKNMNGSPAARGFTLLELVVVLAIIGVLASIAIPSYKRYVNEAKTADLFIKMHRIALAYHELLHNDIDQLADLKPYNSPSFGSPPPTMSDIASSYTSPEGIEFSSALVNHSKYFNFVSDGLIPVLFLKANDDHAKEILHAMDHLLEQKHVFIFDGLMLIALEDPVSRKPAPSVAQVTSPVTKPSCQPHQMYWAEHDRCVNVCNPGFYYVPGSKNCSSTPVVSSQTVKQPDTGTATGTASGTTTGTATGTATGTTTGTATGTAVSTGGATWQSTTGASGSHLNWPPGWAKHPWQHQNQNHPGHGHGNN